MLVNHCADGVPCAEELHRPNRRTEFKVTAFQDGAGVSPALTGEDTLVIGQARVLRHSLPTDQVTDGLSSVPAYTTDADVYRMLW